MAGWTFPGGPTVSLGININPHLYTTSTTTSTYTTSIPLHSVLFPSLANFSTKCGCLNLTLSQLWDNKESVQWSEEWLTVVTIDGTLTGTFLVEKLMRQIVILLHEKKIVSNSSIQVSGWLAGWHWHCLFLINISMSLRGTIINTTKVLPITHIVLPLIGTPGTSWNSFFLVNNSPAQSQIPPHTHRSRYQHSHMKI